jgi:hypothetical protein
MSLLALVLWLIDALAWMVRWWALIVVSLLGVAAVAARIAWTRRRARTTRGERCMVIRQPCPRCSRAMHAETGGWTCPRCGHWER